MITIETMKNFLEYYGYEPTELGLQKILQEWEKNKADLLSHFRKHPNWDEENLAIVFKEKEYERPFNKDTIKEFYEWVKKEILKIIDEKGINIEEEKRNRDRIEIILEKIDAIICKQNIITIDEIKEMKFDENEEKLKIIKNKLTEKINKIEHEKYRVNNKYFEMRYIDKELYQNIQKVKESMSYIINHIESKQLDKEQAEKLSEKSGLEINEGLKVSKAIGKICKILNLDKIKDMKPRNNVEGNELKDYGYAYQYSIMSDNINPLKYKRITVISLNPLDYWGMSFGYKWASCHTIDKKNIRESDKTYEGCYSSGTESYMLDSSSVIFYVIKEDYEGKTYYEEDKMNRVVFCMNEKKDLIVESRVYPDGRDGGDGSLAKQFREVMQRVIADVYDINNYWEVKKGRMNVSDYVLSRGTHYRDYIEYDDANISFLKNSTNGYDIIKIGHDPICPVCGKEHTEADNIYCYDCKENYGNIKRCERCGENIDIDNDDYIEIEGNYYCCEECAEEDGYRRCADDDYWYSENELYYCEDDGNYHNEDNCYQDDYNGYYYSGEPDITTVDGNNYSSEENAIDDNNEYCEDDGEWHDRDDLYYCNDDGCFHNEDNSYKDDYNENYYSGEPYIETYDGNYYSSEENAIAGGYIYIENEDKWYKLDECGYDDYEEESFVLENAEVKTIDGKYFMTKESAENAGYKYNEETDEWVKDPAVA